MDQEKNKDFNQDRQLAVRRALVEFRDKLLDLSGRNRLLNYRHTEQGRQIRLISATLEDIYIALCKNEPIYLNPLPIQEDGFKEEDNESELAKKIGINPTFDLQMSSSPVAGNLDFFQTLLIPDKYARKLLKVNDDAKSSLQELGINTLYCALAFLEWFESDSSDKALLSPLLLHPISMERNIEKGLHIYTVQGICDEDTESNVTLAKRLYHDFALSIPAYTPELSIEEYLSSVQEAVKTKPRWKIKTFATIGTFNFARLAMYEDLVAILSNTEPLLEDNETLLQLLAGKEDRQFDSLPRELPEEAFQLTVSPLLITNADSSQYAALIEACKGTNLVIEGPPGTGKSQTITNIIAALLAQNKSILFVAEKSAALNVVKSRLDDCGLGDFCLELHSTKSNKSDVYTSIRNRLEIKKEEPVTPDRMLLALKAEASFIEGYTNELKSPFGKYKLSVHDMIWRQHRISLEIGNEISTSLENITVKEPEVFSEDQFSSIVKLLCDWHGVRRTILNTKYIKTEDHPLALIYRHQITHQEIFKLKQIIKIIPHLISKVDEYGSLLQAFEPNVLNFGVFDIYNMSSKLLKIKELNSIPNKETLECLKKSDLTVIKNWLSKRKLINTSAKQVPQELLKEANHSLREIEVFLLYASDYLQLLPETNPTSLISMLSMAESKQQRFNELYLFLGDLQSILNFKCSESYELFECLETTRSIIHSTERQILHGRTEASMSVGNTALFNKFIDSITKLKNSHTELSSLYDLSSLKDVVELREDAKIMQSSGYFSFLSKKTTQVRRRFQAICRHNLKMSNKLVSEELSRLAGFLEAYKTFETNNYWEQLLGNTFQGLETDIETVKKLLKLAKEIDAEVSHRGDFGYRLAQFIQNTSVTSLDKLVNLINPNKLIQFRSILEELGSASLEKAREMLGTQVNRIRECLKIWPTGRLANLSYSELLELHQIAQDLNISDSARIENHALANLISNGDEPTISSLEDALYYFTTICDESNLRDSEQQISQADPKDVFLVAKTESLNIRNHYEKLIEILLDFEKITGCTKCNLTSKSTSHILSQFLLLDSAVDDIPDWLRLQELNNQIIEKDLVNFINQYISFKRDALRIDLCFEYVVLRSMLQQAFYASSDLGKPSGQALSNARKDFSTKDRTMIKQNHQYLKNQLMNRKVSRGISSGLRSYWTDGALIELEIAKQKKHLPIRKLIQRAGNALQQLKPCFMMSPLSVSQFIPLDGLKFDVVIIDEASQMRPEDAMGAILRGKQIVVVGDPKQLPPTSFFDKEDHSEDDDDDSIDTESILDLGLQQFGRPRRLLWHYRSCCAGLIAFSNQQFYENELMLFPSPGSRSSSVTSRHVKGRYQARAGVNPIEAKAIAQAAAEFMLTNPESSLGIVALNRAQKDMISNELEMLMRENPKIGEYQSRWENTIEPFIVKNLEMIQGDERDVIFISTVYGPDQQDCMYQRFGPINGKFGWRRLNVLFTRAKKRVEVFTSMYPSDIKVDDQASRGVRALRDYLEYANSAQLPCGIASGKQPDSDFEISIASVLQSAGYNIEPQVGVSGFFIDIGILDPKNNGQFLVGVECDGKTYHSSRSARDRDRLREEVLSKLGWRLIRIWSTDWFSNPRREAIKLLNQVRAIEEERKKSEHQETSVRFSKK